MSRHRRLNQKARFYAAQAQCGNLNTGIWRLPFRACLPGKYKIDKKMPWSHAYWNCQQVHHDWAISLCRCRPSTPLSLRIPQFWGCLHYPGRYVWHLTKIQIVKYGTTMKEGIWMKFVAQECNKRRAGLVIASFPHLTLALGRSEWWDLVCSDGDRSCPYTVNAATRNMVSTYQCTFRHGLLYFFWKCKELVLVETIWCIFGLFFNTCWNQNLNLPCNIKAIS